MKPFSFQAGWFFAPKRCISFQIFFQKMQKQAIYGENPVLEKCGVGSWHFLRKGVSQ